MSETTEQTKKRNQLKTKADKNKQTKSLQPRFLKSLFLEEGFERNSIYMLIY